jgi:glycerol-3-phosphate acyltransferase PlsY
VGATNAGRLLGFRYFLLVFALDMAKGLLPTVGLPWMVGRMVAGEAPASLAVFVAVAAIVGHNFPLYLNFRGGKGVATSLGAVIGLDPYASLAAAVAFVVFMLTTRLVSLASILSALVFTAVHFSRVADPWGRGELAMSVATIALVILLIVRHRDNIMRIARGTEPRVRVFPTGQKPEKSEC